jgi:hypothetical protein
MNELISASDARTKINQATTEASLKEWEVIVGTITRGIECNNSEAYFKRISKPNQNKLASLGYTIKSDPDPREGGGLYVSW